MTLIVLDGQGKGLRENPDFITPAGKADLVHMVTVANTDYQNTNSYPIWFHAKLGANASYQLQLKDAVGTGYTEYTKSDGGAFNFMCMHVPPGRYYRVTGGIWGGYGTAKGPLGDVRTD